MILTCDDMEHWPLSDWPPRALPGILRGREGETTILKVMLCAYSLITCATETPVRWSDSRVIC